MNKIFIPIIMIVIFSCIGCGGEHHAIFKRNGNVVIGNATDIIGILSLPSEEKEGVQGPFELREKLKIGSISNGEDGGRYIDGISQVIIVPYTNVATKAVDFSRRANIVLCGDKLPNGWEMGKSMMVVVIAGLRKAVALTIPSELKKYDLLDDNNLSKGDICIYPADNLSFGNLKESDMFSISKEEMDRAIIEFENE